METTKNYARDFIETSSTVDLNEPGRKIVYFRAKNTSPKRITMSFEISYFLYEWRKREGVVELIPGKEELFAMINTVPNEDGPFLKITDAIFVT